MENDFKVTNDILASHGQRFANYLIDRILFTGIFFAIGFLAAIYGEISGNMEIILFLDKLENINRFLDMLITGFVFGIFYCTMEFYTQRTIGKFITKTMVVLDNGTKPDINSILSRSFCRMIPFDALSFLGSARRGWHDSISKTYVVDVQKFYDKKGIQEGLNDLGITVEEK